ncbi:hypothetical protein FA95DRAFT_1601346 [Auriscalpium vulgare]|uniref:Uncharacterized protein n=1 Tax=Auriscalpium vulgare TaxID=40419 RepID=A0ACB8SAR3_9AGAM|nr:hypothetical protein FA95DRAFT_1601346 [Auriscalpium vulgare]
MPTLSYDIYALILEWSYRISQSQDVDYKTFSSCSLVCRDWTPLSQRFLFRRIRYDCRRKDLLSVIRSKPVLGAYVRSATLKAGDIQCSLAQFADVLRICPGVLNIDFDSPLMDGPLLERHLGAVDVHPTHLTICGDATAVGTLLKLWPSVRYLSTQGVWLQKDPLLEALSGSLQHVRILDSALLHWPERHKLPAWLLSFGGERSSLRSLEIEGNQPATLDFNGLLAKHSLDHIRSLTITDLPTQNVLNKLTNLEELILLAFPTLEKRALPSTLRHFGYHADLQEDFGWPDEASAEQLSWALCRLQDLRFVSTTHRAIPQVYLDSLKDACLGRVEFVIYPDRHSFFRARNVDWI